MRAFQFEPSAHGTCEQVCDLFDSFLRPYIDLRLILVFLNGSLVELGVPEGEEIGSILIRQVRSGVRMKQTIEYLEAQGVDTIIEIGPGKALSGFVKKTASGIKTYAIEDEKSLQTVLGELKD